MIIQEVYFLNESKITTIFDIIYLQIRFENIDKEFQISYQKRYSLIE